MVDKHSIEIMKDGMWGMPEGYFYPEVVILHEAWAGGMVGPVGPVTAYERRGVDDGIFVLEGVGCYPTRGYGWHATEFAEVLRFGTNDNRAGGGSLECSDLFGEFRGMPTVIHVE
jgi:hypothetical protein